MKRIIKIVTAFTFVIGLVTSCESYEDYVNDYEYAAVYFGAQQPLRTLVARSGNDYLEFKIGVTLSGIRENKTGYTARFILDKDLLKTVEGADKFTLLPEDCYTIDNANNVFEIPQGKFLGDSPVRIDKNKFAALPGSLNNTYALPLRLVNSSADTVLIYKSYTVIVIKYIDEHSGNYYCKGSQSEWDGTAIVPETTMEYSEVDLSRNKIRSLTTRSLTTFDMAGMGILESNAVADHLLVKLVDGKVTLGSIPGGNVIEDKGSSYDAVAKTFTLNYIYTKGGKSYLVNEGLTLRQDPEKELRFETWGN